MTGCKLVQAGITGCFMPKLTWRSITRGWMVSNSSFFSKNTSHVHVAYNFQITGGGKLKLSKSIAVIESSKSKHLLGGESHVIGLKLAAN